MRKIACVSGFRLFPLCPHGLRPAPASILGEVRVDGFDRFWENRNRSILVDSAESTRIGESTFGVDSADSESRFCFLRIDAVRSQRAESSENRLRIGFALTSPIASRSRYMYRVVRVRLYQESSVRITEYPAQDRVKS